MPVVSLRLKSVALADVFLSLCAAAVLSVGSPPFSGGNVIALKDMFQVRWQAGACFSALTLCRGREVEHGMSDSYKGNQEWQWMVSLLVVLRSVMYVDSLSSSLKVRLA